MPDRIEAQSEKGCSAPGFWQQIGETLHLVDKSCNQAVEAMKPPANANAEKQVPNLFIDGVEGVRRSGRSGTINKQEAEMLKEI
jgi:hypothetical protein